MTRIRLAGDRDLSSLTPVEYDQYQSLRLQTWISIQNVFFQQELSLVSPRVWAMYDRIACAVWSNPGVKSIWPLQKPLLDGDFVALVEAC